MSEWTSVEDILPEVGQEVLGIHRVGDDGIYLICFLTQNIDYGSWYWESSETGDELTGSFKPTYWMPLPEPPLP